jgi:hypothetical protein
VSGGGRAVYTKKGSLASTPPSNPPEFICEYVQLSRS